MTETIALITGANQGIGLQTAKDLAAAGVTVLIGSRDLGRGEAAAQEVGPAAVAIQLDVTDPQSVAAAADRVRQAYGRLDVLIQNAAIASVSDAPQSGEDLAAAGRPSTIPLRDMREIWDTNVFGVVAVYQAMIPILRTTPGSRIINVSSAVGSPGHIKTRLTGFSGADTVEQGAAEIVRLALLPANEGQTGSFTHATFGVIPW